MTSEQHTFFRPKPLTGRLGFVVLVFLAIAAVVIRLTFQETMVSEAALAALVIGICLYGLAAWVRHRQTRRNGEAMSNRAGTVVLGRPRTYMALIFAGTLALLPEMVLWFEAAWGRADGDPDLMIAASCVLFCAILVALSAVGNVIFKSAPITFDERGIQYPCEWPSILRWTDIKDIRLVPVGRTLAKLVIDLHTPTQLVTKRRALWLAGATCSADAMSIILPQGVLYPPIEEIAASWRQRVVDYGRASALTRSLP
jgi:hypothetical protein